MLEEGIAFKTKIWKNAFLSSSIFVRGIIFYKLFLEETEGLDLEIDESESSRFDNLGEHFL